MSKMGGKLGKRPRIYYVFGSEEWVQERRFALLQRALPEYRWKRVSERSFLLRWRWFGLQKRPVFFGTWRLAFRFFKKHPELFTEKTLSNALASVTSHSNIGGGLNPIDAIGKSDPKAALERAVGFLGRFKTVTVNSNILKALLEPHLSNLTYTPNGVDHQFFSPSPGSHPVRPRLRLGWVGRLRSAKNLELLERVCLELDSSAEWEFVPVTMEKDFSGERKTHEEMRDYYRSLDFLLVTSTNEGTPNPALEALACGVPVITTRVGNMPDLIRHGENGFFYEPEWSALHSVLTEISQQAPTQFARLRTNAREAIENGWTWETQIENFRKAAERLVQKSV